MILAGNPQPKKKNTGGFLLKNLKGTPSKINREPKNWIKLVISRGSLLFQEGYFHIPAVSFLGGIRASLAATVDLYMNDTEKKKMYNI